MKIDTKHMGKASAFTLIEMIGVLAVIAILAALLIPKVFESINNARINNAAVSYNTVKAAVTDHYAKYGGLLNSTNGDGSSKVLTLPVANYDSVLLTEGFLDKPFAVKIGDGSANTKVTAVAGKLATDPVDPTNAAYDLDGTGVVNDAAGSTVVEAIITGVTLQDAKDLNDRLDGNALGAAVGQDDLKGRVKYKSEDPTTVYVYISHR